MFEEADRSEQLRNIAADCLRLAKHTADVKTRAFLTVMADRLHELASGSNVVLASSSKLDLNALSRAYNDQRVLAPKPVQQQQQVQPKEPSSRKKQS